MSRPACYKIHVCPSCTSIYKQTGATSWYDGGSDWCRIDQRVLYKHRDRIFSLPREEQDKLLPKLKEESFKLYKENKETFKWLNSLSQEPKT